MHSRKFWTPKQAQQEVMDAKAYTAGSHACPPQCQAILNAKEVTCGGLQNPADLPPAAADQKL
jgi:hypothetical protein